VAIGRGALRAPVADAAVADVVAAARGFLRELPAEQRAVAARAFDDPQRTSWAFVPGRYAGVEFGALEPASLQRAHALLRALLSAQGFEKTLAIVQLEAVLREVEGRGGGDASHRDQGRYALLLCGEPNEEGAFSVRLQGHHVSLHFTFLDGQLAGATPHFLGSNPHSLSEGPNAGQRVLAAEEELARDLLASLDESQLARALVAERAPPDVLLVPGAGFSALSAAPGLPAEALDEAQRARLWSLVELFARNLRGEFAAAELERLRPQRAELRFAWAGGRERGQGHYWRVLGRTIAIEYDNTQNGANHVHVVWRDLERDFGQDPLRQHLERQHAEAPK
jgi:hypothetical protein